MWPETQSDFAAALLDPALPAPAGLAERRFAVYRNNVTVGLCDALAASFPTVAALVGEDFFYALARDFIRQSPPAGPVLHEYGEGFPAFIAGHAAAGDLPYLPDVARLDWVCLRAYHAADAAPVGIDALAAVPAAALDGLRLSLHPSLALVASDWPVAAIWQAHRTNDPAAALANLPAGGEVALVLRPHLDVIVRAVAGAAGELIAAVAAGQTLGGALAALADAGEAEASRGLAALFDMGAVVAVTNVSKQGEIGDDSNT